MRRWYFIQVLTISLIAHAALISCLFTFQNDDVLASKVEIYTVRVVEKKNEVATLPNTRKVPSGNSTIRSSSVPKIVATKQQTGPQTKYFEEAPPVVSMDNSRPATAVVELNQKPRYPNASRMALEEGLVVLRVEVGENGEVSGVSLESTSGYAALDRSAASAVKRWKYYPALKNGKAIASVVKEEVKFELR